jgi:hypothetical protein
MKKYNDLQPLVETISSNGVFLMVEIHGNSLTIASRGGRQHCFINDDGG